VDHAAIVALAARQHGAGLPAPLTNTTVAGFEVDVA